MTTFTPGSQSDGTWILPSHRVGQLAHRVEVLNRRVKRTGGTGVSLATVREFAVECTDPECPEGPKLLRKWSVLRVEGAVPVVDGWSFVARVEHHDGLGNIVAKAPSCHELDLPADLRTAGATCDHCNAQRNRKDTFVLRDEAGGLRRVGRNCLADFLRGSDPEAALRLWSLLSAVSSLLQGASDDGYEGGEGGGVHSYDTVRFLAATASAIRHDGWVSKAEARSKDKRPTASLASWLCDRAPRGERDRAEWLRMQPSEADFEEAGEIVAWVEGLENLNDYLHNLRVAVLLRHVEAKHEGIVASGVMARRRDIERAAQSAADAARNGALPPSGHVGAVGKRHDVHRATVRALHPINTVHGPTTIVTVQDEGGNDLKWFDKNPGFAPGDVLRGHGTVREHGAFKGRKETMLSRAKFEKVPPGTVDSVAFATQQPLFTQSEEEVPF